MNYAITCFIFHYCFYEMSKLQQNTENSIVLSVAEQSVQKSILVSM